MLPLATDYPPMEAQLVKELPRGRWQLEPKWDGFRCLAFRDGSKVALSSKSGQPLARYFPEIVQSLLASEAKRFVLDGELIIYCNEQFSFDDLLERIHPAESRINKLSRERPAVFVLFDMLVDDTGAQLVGLPVEERRIKLEEFYSRHFGNSHHVVLSPCSTDWPVTDRWWQKLGAGMDGIIAKRLGEPYQSGNRKGMVKVKKIRTADCVVGGFRYASNSKVIGSLLLGLYDKQGALHHVGYSSAFSNAERLKLKDLLEPFIGGAGFTGKSPGGPSRWNSKRSEIWVPLKPELVVEVEYDHVSGDRFRHGTRLLRWRPDKLPQQCTFEQIGI